MEARGVGRERRSLIAVVALLLVAALAAGILIGSGALVRWATGPAATAPQQFAAASASATLVESPPAGPGGTSSAGAGPSDATASASSGVVPTASPTPTPRPTTAPTPRPTATRTPAGTPVHWFTPSPSPSPSPTPRLPNLTVGYINLPLHPTCGIVFNVNAMITNNGPVNSPATHVHVTDRYMASEHLFEADIVALPSGHGIGVNVSVHHPLGSKCDKTHTIIMEVDPHHAITEGTETDNQRHRQYLLES